MRKKWIYWLGVGAMGIAFIASGCKTGNNSPQYANHLLQWNAYADSLFFVPDSGQYMDDGTPIHHLDLKVSCSYPTSVAPEGQALSDSIGRKLQYALLGEEAMQQEPFDSVAKKFFISSYQEYLQDMQAPNFESLIKAGMTYIRTGYYTSKLLYNDKDYVSLEINKQEYSGGAHGIENFYYLNYDLQNNRELTLADILQSPDSPQLLRLIIQKIQERFGVTTQKELEAIGIYSADEIPIPTNIHFDADSIYFHYNPYEIAAYVIGSIDVGLSYEQLTPYLKDPFKSRITKN